MKQLLVTVTITTTLLAAAAPGMASGSAAAGKTKAAACFACHGADGNGASAAAAKLAGQMPEYLVKQMRDFQAGRRDECKGMDKGAAVVSETDIADLAAYFTDLPIRPEVADKARLALGEQIFSKGKKVPHFVPACVGCHGLQGKGKRDWNLILSAPPAILPSSIGGQHPVYIQHELKAFREGRRSNDQAAVMRKLAENLSDEEIDAVAAYAAALLR